MLKNICRNYWITLLNDARRIAEGLDKAELSSKQYTSFKQYIDEAKRRFVVIQGGIKEDILREQLLLGFTVSDRHIGARLLDVIEENIKHSSLLPTTAHVLVQLDVWLQKPQRGTLIEKLLAELWQVNYDLPDNSPSAVKSLVGN